MAGLRFFAKARGWRIGEGRGTFLEEGERIVGMEREWRIFEEGQPEQFWKLGRVAPSHRLLRTGQWHSPAYQPYVGRGRGECQPSPCC